MEYFLTALDSILLGRSGRNAVGDCECCEYRYSERHTLIKILKQSVSTFYTFLYLEKNCHRICPQNWLWVRECKLVEGRASRKGVNGSQFVVFIFVVKCGWKSVKEAAFHATEHLWVFEIWRNKEYRFVMSVHELIFAHVPFKILTF
jgi:hypothetical protein